MTYFLFFNQSKLIDFQLKMIDYQSETTDCKARNQSLIRIIMTSN